MARSSVRRWITGTSFGPASAYGTRRFRATVPPSVAPRIWGVQEVLSPRCDTGFSVASGPRGLFNKSIYFSPSESELPPRLPSNDGKSLRRKRPLRRQASLPGFAKSWKKWMQVIVFENEEPPAEVMPSITYTHFAAARGEGQRYGFSPHQSSSSIGCRGQTPYCMR